MNPPQISLVSPSLPIYALTQRLTYDEFTEIFHRPRIPGEFARVKVESEPERLRAALSKLIAACSTSYGSGVKQPSIHDLIEAEKALKP